jgi:hypothetical protein
MALTYYLSVEGKIWGSGFATPGGCLSERERWMQPLAAFEAIMDRPAELDIVGLNPEQVAAHEEHLRRRLEEF